MKAKELPPVELLREWFIYDPETGKLYWKKTSKYSPIKVGSEAGGVNRGRLRVRVSGRGLFEISRIAWKMYHGEEIGEGEFIDHIDRNSLNNRITNLRKVSRSENNFNRKFKPNKSGHQGISWMGRCWGVHVGGEYIGGSVELSEAIKMREQAIKERGLTDLCAT